MEVIDLIPCQAALRSPLLYCVSIFFPIFHFGLSYFSPHFSGGRPFFLERIASVKGSFLFVYNRFELFSYPRFVIWVSNNLF